MSENMLKSMIVDIDNRSKIAQWMSFSGEIIVVNIQDLLWIPNKKLIKNIAKDYSYNVRNDIIIAKKKIITPKNSLVLIPHLTNTIHSLELKFSAKKNKTKRKKNANVFAQKTAKNNTIWIGPSTSYHTKKEQKAFSPTETIDIEKKSNILSLGVKNIINDSENDPENLIHTQIISQEKNPLLDKKNNLWVPEEKQNNLFGDQYPEVPKPKNLFSTFSENEEKDPFDELNERYEKNKHQEIQKIRQKNAANKLRKINEENKSRPKKKLCSQNKNQKSIDIQSKAVNHYIFGKIFFRNKLGSLYNCKHKETERKYFAWVLQQGYSFATTADALKVIKLEHRCMLKVKDVFSYKERTVIILRHSSLVPLRVYLKKNPLDLRQKLYFIQILINAIQHAHGSLVFHGNLLPSNILVDSQGCPRIIGFAIEKTSTTFPEKGISSLPPTKTSLSIVGYLKINKDILGVGYILYEMITGKPILRNNKRKQNSGEFTFPTHLSKEIPAKLQHICVKSVDHRKEYRYESLDEIKDDINLFLNNPNQTQWSYFSYRLITWWGQHRDRANVYFIGLTIFLSLWLVPSNIGIPDFLNPAAQTQEEIIANLISDLNGKDRVLCVMAINKLKDMGVKEALPDLERLTWASSRVIRKSAQLAVKKLSENIRQKKITLTTESILSYLDHPSTRWRSKALDAISHQKNVDKKIITKLLSVASYDIRKEIKEKAQKVLRNLPINGGNLNTFTEHMTRRTRKVRRIIVGKVVLLEKNDILIEKVIEFINDNDKYTQTLVFKFLNSCNLKDNKWIRKLVPKLDKIDRENHAAVYQILGNIKPIHPKYLSYLTFRLTSRHRHIKIYAQQSITQIDLDYPETTSYLMEVFEGGTSHTKEWVLRGLTGNQKKNSSIILLLQQGMSDKNESVRRWAATCAGRMYKKGVSLMPELQALLNDEKLSVRKEAFDALERIR